MPTGAASEKTPPGQSLEPGARIDLIALSVQRNNVLTRPVGREMHVVFRPRSHIWEIAEGQLLTVLVERAWVFGHTQYLSGGVVDRRLDVKAWGLPALHLRRWGEWDPEDWANGWEERWPGSVPPWKASSLAPEVRTLYRKIIAAGRRPIYEMEQVLPGSDPDDPFTDPILDAIDARDAGDWDGAHELLQNCLRQDLRCIDAHAHLGNFRLNYTTSEFGVKEAERHYRVGVAVGDEALGPDFRGLLPAGHVDNRPFFRSLHGLGLCRWRLGDFDEARRIFSRLLWLDPDDRMGATWLLDQVERGEAWRSDDSY